jgi:hypothetical protein
MPARDPVDNFWLLVTLVPVALAVVAAALDPANHGLRTGDPWYGCLYRASTWVFLAALASLPAALFARFSWYLVRLVRRCFRPPT